MNNNHSENALTYHLSFYRGHPDRIKKDVCNVLHAAGETIHNASVEQPDFMKHDVTLKHLCREAIRKHLLNVNPNQHLFERVLQLGLPSSLAEHLLYDVLLNDDDNDSEDDDDEDNHDNDDYLSA